MKLSWSHKLFLRINKQIGARPWRDRVMHVCGHELIYVLGFVCLLWATAVLYPKNPALLNKWLKLLMTAGIFGLGISWLIAIIFPHRRPIREIPTIVQLVTPLSTWKSFPSDHTIVSFIIVGVSIGLGTSLWFSILLLLMAAAVAFGRVYVGVHYPRDIVGGFVVALISVLSADWLLNYMTQPLYDLFNTFF